MPLIFRQIKYGFIFCNQFGPARHVFVTVMQIVNDADVGDAVFFQSLDNFDLIFRFAKPRAMIIKPDAHTEFGCFLRDRFEARCFSFPRAALVLRAFSSARRRP